MAHTVTLVPGDSPATIDAARRILDAAGVDITWDVQHTEAGAPTSELLASIRNHRTALLGFQKGRRHEGKAPPIVQLRRELGVFANVRPVHAVAGIPTRFPEADIVIVRETTEDVYAQLEHESLEGVFESLKVTTQAGCERIARYAFESARRMGRKKVTVVHKANIMKRSDGMFLSVGREMGQEYPEIETEDCIVDALCMKLVKDPSQFDVLLCGNLFGDIVADLAAGLVGGRANAPSMNVGPDGLGLFTTGHGDRIEDVGTPSCSPTSLCFASVLMLRHIGENDAADRVMKAVEDTLATGTRPPVIGGEAVAAAFADAVTSRL